MTTNDITNKIQEFRPDIQFDMQKYWSWIKKIENKIYNDIILKHEMGADSPVPIFIDGTGDFFKEQLMLPDDHSDIYVYYIISQIDLMRNEMTRYANSSALFNTAYMEYARYVNRHYLPKQPNSIHIGGI